MSYINEGQTAETGRVRLGDGHEIPRLGLGVFALDHESTARSVESAIGMGYRSIDTASIYGNEAGVAEGIRRSGIDRDSLFLTTKLWNDDHERHRTSDALARSLDALGIETVDLYLIHWPVSTRGRYLEAWEGLESLRAAGFARSIGVSNFSTAQLDEVIALGGSVPVVNQIESHPFYTRGDEVCENGARGVVTQAWSPLARGSIFGDPVLARIAGECDATVAQVALAWNLARGVVVIPKASSPERLAENLRAAEVVLTGEQVAAIDALDEGVQVEASYYVHA